MSTAVVLQARIGSTRLPGKVLQQVGSRTLLDHAVTRLRESELPVIVATTREREDAAIVREAKRLGAEVFRGATDDVLGRFLDAAQAFALDLVVRATADNPFVDGPGAGRVLRLARRMGADYVIECGLPVGAAVEAVTTDALARAASLTTDAYDREHVTPFIRRDSRFRTLRAMPPGDLRRPGLRLTIDTAEDLEFAQRVYRHLDVTDRLPPLSQVITATETMLIDELAHARVERGA